jgi:hypothetical protein
VTSVLPDLERDLAEAAERWLPVRDAPTIVKRRRRWRRTVLGSAGLVVAATAAAFVVLVGVGGESRSLALAARAYERTSAAPGQILYSRVTATRTVIDDAGEHLQETITIEEWHRGRETHRIETYRSPSGKLTDALDHVISADGVMRQIDLRGAYRIVRPSDNQDAAAVIRQQQAGLIEDFRRRYKEGRLDPSGDQNFAGRPAQRYLVTPHVETIGGGRVPFEPRQYFYVDRETGLPLGYTSTLPVAMPAGAGVAAPGSTRYVQTVGTIKHLEPTPHNLAKLHHLVLPRRRDAQGCIRGPIEDGRSSDLASKRDCGGTPGAVVHTGTAPRSKLGR